MNSPTKTWMLSRQLAAIVFLVGTLVGMAMGAPAPALFGGPFILGSSVYSARDFAPQIAPHVGQPTSAVALESLRNAIQTRYVRDGYITPIIVVPPQDLQSANPRLVIHEARISGVEIRGDAGPYRAQIDALTRSVLQSAPLRKELLRTVLYRIAHLPGISSRPLIDPRPESTNEFLLVLRVQYRAVTGQVELNNGGTRGLGRELLAADLETNGLLKLNEQIRLSGVVSSRPDRYNFEELHLQRGFFDTTLFADISGSKAVPDDDIFFRDTHFSVGVSQQWQLAANRNASLAASFNGENGTVRDATTVPLLDDHERSFAVGFTLANNTQASSSRAFLGVQRGLDVGGSTINEGEYSEADARYLKYLVDGEQVIALSNLWSVQLDLNVQYTSAIVPVLERFTFGGIGFGAAFDPGSISGDSGAEVSVQVARVIHFQHWGLQYTRLYVRSDSGVTWNNSSYFYHREQATSAGGGVFARWPHVKTTIELSTPIDQPSYVSAQSVRTFGSVAYIF